MSALAPATEPRHLIGKLLAALLLAGLPYATSILAGTQAILWILIVSTIVFASDLFMLLGRVSTTIE